MKQLASYLKDNGMSQREFAALIKKSEGIVSRYLRGTVRPDLDTAFQIERLTKGAVPVYSWERQ